MLLSYQIVVYSSICIAGCDHVMWLDADDVLDPDAVRKLLELKDRLTAETDVVFIAYRNYGFLTDLGLRDRIHRRELACRWPFRLPSGRWHRPPDH